MPAPKRTIVQLQLDPKAKKQLEDICELRGMTQVKAMSRLVDWFAGQDDVTQTAILSRLSPEALAPLARMVLEKAARGERV